MSDAPILVSHEGTTSTITVNRPKALNALNRDVLEGLGAALAEVDARTETRCAILTGAGGRAFVAGADIEAMSQMSTEQAAAFAALGDGAMAAVEALRVPVIAAVPGFALGGGCELALACDFVYASEKAKFGQPEVKLGIIPGFGGTQRLSRRVGLGLARELTYTGRMIGAEEALRIGLVNAVVPPDALMDRVQQVADEIAAVGPLAVDAAKRTMLHGADRPLSSAIEAEAAAFSGLFATGDQREGMRAFLDKREPGFKRS